MQDIVQKIIYEEVVDGIGWCTVAKV